MTLLVKNLLYQLSLKLYWYSNACYDNQIYVNKNLYYYYYKIEPLPHYIKIVLIN